MQGPPNLIVLTYKPSVSGSLTVTHIDLELPQASRLIVAIHFVVLS